MKRFSLILAAILVLGLIGVLAVNAYDPPLKAEVQKIIAATPEPAESPAYFFLLGVYAGEKHSPAVRGQEIYEGWKALTPDARPEFLQNNLREREAWHTDFPGCSAGSGLCTASDVGKDPELRNIIENNHDLLQNYIKLLEYADVNPMIMPSPEQPLMGLTILPARPHALFTLQISDWALRGGAERVFNLLELSNRYFTSVMKHGNLLERMIAVRDMSMNAEWLKMELERQPKLKARLTPQLIESFQTPSVHEILNGAMEDELRILANVCEHVRRANALDLAEDLQFKLPARFFLRFNETLNKYYDISSESLATDCPGVSDDNERACVPSSGWMHPRWPWQWAVNPVGKILVRTLSVNLANRRIRMQRAIEQIYEARQEFSRL